MRKLFALLVLSLSALSLAAQDSKPLYEQVAKWTIGGEGGWDYLTLDPAGNRLFIAHSNNIEAIDLGAGKKVGEIPASGAHGVALVPEKHLGFSTNGRAGTVTVFDSLTLKPQAEIKVGENPDAIIYDPNSKHIIVMNGRSKDLMAIDPATLKVIATVPLGGKLEFAAADAGRVYINVEDTGEIASVDTKTWKAAQRWKLTGCDEPSGLALDPTLGHLFAVCGNKQMVVVDVKSRKQIAALPIGDGTDAAAFDPVLKLAFASNGEGTLTIVRQTQDGKYEVAGNVPTARGARTMALDPKSHKIYLATADFGPQAEGQKRPSIKPETFTVFVYAPAK
ncbi:MAG TPA: YncE family protein [Clostridia bacterium]|nr:YncE family protein [Clostridia bacterium]